LWNGILHKYYYQWWFLPTSSHCFFGDPIKGEGWNSSKNYLSHFQFSRIPNFWNVHDKYIMHNLTHIWPYNKFWKKPICSSLIISSWELKWYVTWKQLCFYFGEWGSRRCF
jgi:hypothetical protein